MESGEGLSGSGEGRPAPPFDREVRDAEQAALLL